MANTYEIRDLEATPIDEEHLINIKAKTLELSLT
jgi:hypothetical protein